MMSFEKLYNNFVFGCKSSSWCYVLENKPAQPKKKAGGGGGWGGLGGGGVGGGWGGVGGGWGGVGGGLGGGGRGRSPPICKHSVVMTGSERVHMGSVFAGRMMLEATLLSSIKFVVKHILTRHNILQYD